LATINAVNELKSQNRRQATGGRGGEDAVGIGVPHRRHHPENAPGVGRTVSLRLESSIGYVDMVHEMAERFARRVGFAKPLALNIGLAVREAVINAIKHGNSLDATKSIEVSFEQDNGLFRVRVRDEGPGFDWEHTANPLDRENLFRTSGRGIFFMKHFVDKVEFQRRKGKGTEVVLEKKFEQAGRAGRGGGEVIKRRKG